MNPTTVGALPDRAPLVSSAFFLEYAARVTEDGTMELNRKKLAAEVREFLAGQDVTLTIRVASKRRTTTANAYLWGVVYVDLVRGFRSLGERDVTVEDVHYLCKKWFLKGREIVICETGEVETVPASTARLSREEFGEYIDKIKEFALHNLSIAIREPARPVTSYVVSDPR